MKIENFQQKIGELKDLGFTVKEGKVGDTDVVLITAYINTQWAPERMIFRSSVWTLDGKLVSPSYKKFFNYGEQPAITPPPASLKNAVMLDKIDGSCLIFSKVNGVLVARTRGTLDAKTTMVNGYEIDELLKKYPKLVDNELINSEEYSVIVEWYSPDNVIVLRYGEDPDFTLTGVINHEDYSYLSQPLLDKYAIGWGIKRPMYYDFGSLPEMLKGVEGLKGKEGLCLYYNDFQNILKVKSADYLMKHAFKSAVTPENLIDIYLKWNMPEYQDFVGRIETEFDYECMVMAQGLVSKIVGAKREIDRILDHMKSFVEPLKSAGRKEAAEKIIQAYGKTNRSGLAFTLLDGKELKEDSWKKLLLQTLGGS